MSTLEATTFSAWFDELEPGTSFSTCGRTVCEADVVAFATLTGDMHPQHVDASWAARSRFGERIAHGMLLLSYAAGLVPFDSDRVVALRRVRDAVFKRPVPIGETIRVDGTLEPQRVLDDDHGLVSCRWRILDGNDRTVVRATVEAVWLRDPALSQAPLDQRADDDGLLEPSPGNNFVPLPL